MRVVNVTDIHWLNTADAEAMLMEAICFANGDVDGIRADVFVDLGDRIRQEGLIAGAQYWGAFNDAQSLMQIAPMFNQLHPEIARFHIEGNHDGALSSEMMDDILKAGLSEAHKASIHTGHFIYDPKDAHVRLMMWNANVRDRCPDNGYAVTQDDLKVLTRGLATSSRPVLLFNHIALDKGNTPKFINSEGKLIDFYYPFYENGVEIKDVISAHGNVALSMNGHLHRFKRPLALPAAFDGAMMRETQFLRLPANAKNWSKGSFSVLDVDDAAVHVRIMGDFSRREDWQGDAPEDFTIPLCEAV